MRHAIDTRDKKRLDMRGSGPADLLSQPACHCSRRLSGGKDVRGKDNAPAANEKVGRKVTVLINNLAPD